MKILITFLFSLFTFSVQAQTEPAAYKESAALIQRSYNMKDYAALHKAFDDNMGKYLPVEKIGEVFDGLRASFGDIQEMRFLSLKEGRADYKTVFQRGTLLTIFALDKDGKMTGLQFKPYSDKAYPVITRNKTPLILPFKEEWYTGWGGDTKEQNYHVESKAQKGAFDFLIVNAAGETHGGDGTKNEDYFAFGKDILAPCDGVITDVVDGVRDNIPGEVSTMFVPGNMVIMKAANDEYLFFAHFMQQSIKVKPGDKVKKGAVLGRCGNSGHSTEAHLHFHIQNTYDTDNATGAKAYFEKITVTNDAGSSVKQDYSPVRGDKIKN